MVNSLYKLKTNLRDLSWFNWKRNFIMGRGIRFVQCFLLENIINGSYIMVTNGNSISFKSIRELTSKISGGLFAREMLPSGSWVADITSGLDTFSALYTLEPSNTFSLLTRTVKV